MPTDCVLPHAAVRGAHGCGQSGGQRRQQKPQRLGRRRISAAIGMHMGPTSMAAAAAGGGSRAAADGE